MGMVFGLAILLWFALLGLSMAAFVDAVLDAQEKGRQQKVQKVVSAGIERPPRPPLTRRLHLPGSHAH